NDENLCVLRAPSCVQLIDRGLTVHPPAGLRWSMQLTDCEGYAVEPLAPAELVVKDGDLPGGGVSEPAAPNPFETYVLVSIDLSSGAYRRGLGAAMIETARAYVTAVRRGAGESRLPFIGIQTYGRSAETSIVQAFTQDYDRVLGVLDSLTNADFGLGIANSFGAYRQGLTALRNQGAASQTVERVLFVVTGGPHEAGDFENQRQLAMMAKSDAEEDETTVMLIMLAHDAGEASMNGVRELATDSPDAFRQVEIGRPLLVTRMIDGFARQTNRIGSSVISVGVCTPLELGMGRLTATITRDDLEPVELSTVYPTEEAGLNGDVRPDACQPEVVAQPCANRACGPSPVDGFQCGSCVDGTSCRGTDEGGTACVAVCGDMRVGPGEVCDGNAGCAPDCTSLCGDSIIEGREVCDGQAGCAPDCSALCGDGVIGPGEVCDGEEGCSQDCRTRCGDGRLEPGEGCDDGDRIDGNACTNACRPALCGDGVVHEGEEECDDGNSIDGDTCTNDCEKAQCGDGIVHVDEEECDDGNENSKDGCTADCRLPICGDGIVQEAVGETCDDGNRIDGDTCTNECTIAACGDGALQVGLEACDDGNLIATDACTDSCELARCGDGIHHIGVEECDDGDGSSDDECDSNCLVPRPNMDFVRIVGGIYQMGVIAGNADEMPRHEVRVRDVYFSRREVTVGQYRACVRAGACDPPGTGTYSTWRPMPSGVWDIKPINYVSWHNAQQYAHWVGARLPSESEWEYAATSSGQSDYVYPWGDTEPNCELAQYLGCNAGVADVGEHPAGRSVHGLDDLAGNVAEWIQDEYLPSYDGAPDDGSARESGVGGLARVVRGGSFTFDAMNLRSTDRDNFPAETRLQHIGIRLACVSLDRDGHCVPVSD
ncbi:MAG: SUMF1/EgtB/PvdO family nonheme iron enzyme, partial [Myxococcota bacterium]|nr:SUMF1/EgtB/PvdO family nonheme iron enzyme [Myxococcota bacterium]